MTQENKLAPGQPVRSVVIQCPMCADFDPDATCRLCSLLSARDVEEWRTAVAVAGPVPNTGVVPVKARTILAVDRLIANAVAAQAEPTNTSPQVPEDTARHLIDTLRIDARGGRAATVHDLDAAANWIESLLADLDAKTEALKSVQAAIYMDDAGQLRLTRSFDESVIDTALKGTP